MTLEQEITKYKSDPRFGEGITDTNEIIEIVARGVYKFAKGENQ